MPQRSKKKVSLIILLPKKNIIGTINNKLISNWLSLKSLFTLAISFIIILIKEVTIEQKISMPANINSTNKQV